MPGTSTQGSCTVLLLDSADRYGYAGPASAVDDGELACLARDLRAVWPRQRFFVDRCVAGTDWIEAGRAPGIAVDGVSQAPYFTDVKRLRAAVPTRYGRLAVVRAGAALLPAETLRDALAHARSHELDLVTVDGIPHDVFHVVSRRAVDLVASAGAVPGCVTVAQAIERLLSAAPRRDLPLTVARLGPRDVAWPGQALASALLSSAWKSPPLQDVLGLPSSDRLGAALRLQQEAFDSARASLAHHRTGATISGHHPRRRVLVTVPSLFQSGANAAWEEVSSYLAPDEVAFVVGRGTVLNRTLEARGFTVVEVADGMSADSIADTAVLLDTLDSMRPSIVHFDGAEGSTWAPLVFARGARIVQHVRLNDVDRFRRAFGYSDAVVTVSEGLRREVASRVGGAVRVEHIPDGVCLETRPPRTRSAGRSGVGDGPLRCLCVGRVEPEKGQLRVLEIVRALCEHVPCRLAIVGSCGSDPAYCDEVTSQVLSPSAHVSVTWRTFTHPLSASYDEADVVLVGSRNEALGMVGLEALAAGCLLVARRSTGYESIVDPSRGEGLLFEGDEPAQGVAVRIIAALGDAATHAAMARRKAETSFDARQTAARLSRLWREVSQQA